MSDEEYVSDQGKIDAEKVRYRGWKELYTDTHHEPQAPEKQSLSFFKMMGLEASVLYIASFSGLILAALRTGAIFMLAEQKLLLVFNITSDPVFNLWLPRISMGAALLTFEGFLFGVGLIKGRKSGDTDISWWGISTAFFVSAVAGIASSLPLTGTTVDSVGGAGTFYRVLTWVLVFTSGIGATLMAYLGAENIGVLYNQHEAKVKTVLDEFADRHETWATGMENDYRKTGRSNVYGVERWSATGKTEASRAPAARQVSRNSDSVMGKVRSFLDERSLKASMVGDGPEFAFTPNAIAVATNSDGGAVRTSLSRLRKEEEVSN